MAKQFGSQCVVLAVDVKREDDGRWQVYVAGGRKASVLSILTTWVWTGSPFVVPSAMSKAGVAVMTQSLAVEWGRHGIRLNAIAPGPFPTEGAWARLNPMKDSDDDRYKTRNPMGRVGKPHELANMAAFLMSDEVAYINGEVIAIDGGMGIMGNGTFSNMLAYSEDDWRRIREQIQSTNAADRAKRREEKLKAMQEGREGGEPAES